MYQPHPWLIHANLWRMPLGPHVLDIQEDLYRAVRLTGLRADDVVAGRRAGGVARLRRGPRRRSPTPASRRNTGVTADDYWESRSSFWGTYYTAERFPTMTCDLGEPGLRPAAAGDDLDFGLQRLLDGVELLVSRSRA